MSLSCGESELSGPDIGVERQKPGPHTPVSHIIIPQATFRVAFLSHDPIMKGNTVERRVCINLHKEVVQNMDFERIVCSYPKPP